MPLLQLRQNICQSTFISHAHFAASVKASSADPFATAVQRAPHPVAIGSCAPRSSVACSHPAAWSGDAESTRVTARVAALDVAYEPSDFTFYYNFLRKGATAATPDSLTWRGADFAQRSGTAIALIRIGLLADDGSPVSVVPTGDMDDVAAGCADLIDDCARAHECMRSTLAPTGAPPHPAGGARVCVDVLGNGPVHLPTIVE